MTWKRYAEWAARARVPSGFLVLAVYALVARPDRPGLIAGGAVAFAGLLLRAYAAGHLDKNRSLATSGPYAYTRNPLYLGTALVALGFTLAGGVWWLGLLFAVYLIAIYMPVVGEEEAHLAKIFPEYRAYASSVPRFWPGFAGKHPAGGRFRWRLYLQNREYNALLGYLFGIGLLLWILLR